MMQDISLRTVESTVAEGNSGQSGARTSQDPKVFYATLCCYVALDFDNLILCGRQKSDGCCFNTRLCFDSSADSLGVGCLEEKEKNEYCKLGGYCFTCAFKQPELSCTSHGQWLCLRSIKSYPFNPDYVEKPICACCFLQCFPTPGCMKTAPDCPAHQDLVEVGGGVITTHVVAKNVIRSHKMDR
ncbi:hypothetical protein ACHAWF_006713 [Thalassiosira exigua]